MMSQFKKYRKTQAALAVALLTTITPSLVACSKEVKTPPEKEAAVASVSAVEQSGSKDKQVIQDGEHIQARDNKPVQVVDTGEAVETLDDFKTTPPEYDIGVAPVGFTKTIEADIVTNAGALALEGDQDLAEFNKKYQGKIVEISGYLYDMHIDMSQEDLLLEAPENPKVTLILRGAEDAMGIIETTGGKDFSSLAEGLAIGAGVTLACKEVKATKSGVRADKCSNNEERPIY